MKPNADDQQHEVDERKCGQVDKGETAQPGQIGNDGAMPPVSRSRNGTATA